MHNEMYAKWVDLLRKSVNHFHHIPFLPISAFKNHKVFTPEQHKVIYTSSGTTSATTSRHYIADEQFYLDNCVAGFEQYYGDVSEYCFLALLPNYLEREGSSLIKMVDHFIDLSFCIESGFYLYDHEALYQQLLANQDNGIKTVLIGVSFALWDLAEKYKFEFPELIVMETGGMKGQRKEIPREELHDIFKASFGVSHIHSEYGMTELLSQGYSSGDGIFKTTHSMQVKLSALDDPFRSPRKGKAGRINIIDLANVDSCSFIATDDIGRIYEDGSFEVLGRIDHSDLRGCNLLIGEE